MKSKRSSYIFNQKDAFENVCEMAASLSRLQCIDKGTDLLLSADWYPVRHHAIIWTNADRKAGMQLNAVSKLSKYPNIQIERSFTIHSSHATFLTQTRYGISAATCTGDPLHSRAACTQPCNVNTHSRAHCSPGARLCEQWGHGCVNNGARLCASARLCRGSPVTW